MVILPEKVKKLIPDKVPYYSASGIFLPLKRTLESLLLKDGDIITFKKKDKKPQTIRVNLADSEGETIEIFSNTTTWGAIQLIKARCDGNPTMFSLYTSKGKRLEHKDKLSLKKDDVVEYRADLEKKDGKLNSSGFGVFNVMKRAKSRLSQKSSKRLSDPRMQPTHKLEAKSILDKFLSERPTEKELKDRKILVDYKSEHRFAAPVAADPSMVPPLNLQVVEKLLKIIGENLNVVGLFRVSGGVEVVENLYQQFWFPDRDLEDIKDAHIYTSALKLYLRKQAEPLIPFSLYDRFIKAQKVNDYDQRVEEVRKVVQCMPSPNDEILYKLVYLLKKVTDNQSVNMMGSHNLGIVFGPSIMWDPNPGLLDFSATGYQSSLVDTMISNFEEIWMERLSSKSIHNSNPVTTQQPTVMLQTQPVVQPRLQPLILSPQDPIQSEVPENKPTSVTQPPLVHPRLTVMPQRPILTELRTNVTQPPLVPQKSKPQETDHTQEKLKQEDDCQEEYHVDRQEGHHDDCQEEYQVQYQEPEPYVEESQEDCPTENQEVTTEEYDPNQNQESEDLGVYLPQSDDYANGDMHNLFGSLISPENAHILIYRTDLDEFLESLAPEQSTVVVRNLLSSLASLSKD